jgi:hypothetical protein
MSKSDWIESVYLDIDIILAELKADDWPASDIDIDSGQVESEDTPSF